MLHRASALTGYAINARDGSIGSVEDLLFDTRDWTLRWAVIDTGKWLPGRQVLLPPSILGAPDTRRREFDVQLTRAQVEASPGAEQDRPVTRQHEVALYAHFGWLPYWGATVPPIGPDPLTPPIMPSDMAMAGDKPGLGDGDPSLQSIGDITGYGLEARDGDIGEVEDFLVDEPDWAIRYIIVDTGRWLPGKKVLIAPASIRDIGWDDRRIHVDLTRQAVKDSPEYKADMLVDRAWEQRWHDYHGLPNYWV